LLVRADLRPPAFHLSDVHADIFDAVYVFNSTMQIPAGWISAMVHSGNRHFRLLTTHLQSPVSGDSTAAAVQEAQAKQLLHEVRNSADPVVIAGDFNSDAIQGVSGPGPDNTGTAALIQAAFYEDTWNFATTASGSGKTWPYYLEDQYPLLPGPQPFVAPFFPFERIDLIFSQGLNVMSVEDVIQPGPAVRHWPYFASDHAGVLATFQF
jgi:endonuclease/exonuclease/phosphatase family metal-dependent hydrolase